MREGVPADLPEDSYAERGIILWADFPEDNARGLPADSHQVFCESKSVDIICACDIICICFSWEEGFVIVPESSAFQGVLNHFKREFVWEEKEFIVIPYIF